MCFCHSAVVAKPSADCLSVVIESTPRIGLVFLARCVEVEFGLVP